MRRKLPLPRGWNRHARKSVLQVLSFTHYCFSTLRGWGVEPRSGSRRRLII